MSNTNDYKINIGVQMDDTAIRRGVDAMNRLKNAADNVGSSVASTFTRYFTAVAIEEFVRRSFTALASLDRQITLVGMGAKATSAEMVAFQQEIVKYAALTGQSMGQLVDNFRQFQTDTGLAFNDARDQFAHIVLAARATGSEIADMGRLAGAAFHNLQIPLKEVPAMIDAWAIELPDKMMSVFAKMAPRLTAQMADMGFTGRKAGLEVAAVFDQLQRALGQPRLAATAMSQLFSQMANFGNPLGNMLLPQLEAIRKSGGGLRESLQAALDVLKQYGAFSESLVKRGFAKQALGLDDTSLRAAHVLKDHWTEIWKEVDRTGDSLDEVIRRHMELERGPQAAVDRLYGAWEKLKISLATAVVNTGFVGQIENITQMLQLASNLMLRYQQIGERENLKQQWQRISQTASPETKKAMEAHTAQFQEAYMFARTPEQRQAMLAEEKARLDLVEAANEADRQKLLLEGVTFPNAKLSQMNASQREAEATASRKAAESAVGVVAGGVLGAALTKSVTGTVAGAIAGGYVGEHFERHVPQENTLETLKRRYPILRLLFPGSSAPPPLVPQHALGTDYVPETGPAVVHRGEMIIPTDEAERLRGGGSQRGVTAALISDETDAVRSNTYATKDNTFALTGLTELMRRGVGGGGVSGEAGAEVGPRGPSGIMDVLTGRWWRNQIGGAPSGQAGGPRGSAGAGAGTGTMDEAAFNQKFKGTALEGHYADVVKAAQENNVPPAVMAGIIAHETGNGRVLTGNNVAGLMDPATGMQRKQQFPSISAGIAAAGRTIGKRYNEAGGDLDRMGRVYAPVGAANDPRGLNRGWAAGVRKQMGELGGAADNQERAMDPMALAGTPARNQDLVQVKTSHGRTFMVPREYAANYQGFIDDYEAAGGVIGSSSGTMGTRGNASYHPLGRAIDINQVGYGVRSKTGVTLPTETENAIARKWGFYPGSMFHGRSDVGHFEIRNQQWAARKLMEQQSATAAASEKPDQWPSYGVTKPWPGEEATLQPASYLGDAWAKARPWVEGGIAGGLGHEDAASRFLHNPEALWGMGLMLGGMPSAPGAGYNVGRMGIDAAAGLLGTYERLRQHHDELSKPIPLRFNMTDTVPYDRMRQALNNSARTRARMAGDDALAEFRYTSASDIGFA